MIIEKLKDTKNEQLVAFKKKEWSHANTSITQQVAYFL